MIGLAALSVLLAAPSRGIASERWRSMNSGNGRFTVRLPGRPVRTLRWIDGPQKTRLAMHELTGETRDAAYSVSYADYPTRTIKGLKAAQILDRVCVRLKAAARGRIVRQTTISLQGRQGRELRVRRDPLVDESGTPYLFARCFLSGRRVYQLLQAGTSRSPNLRFFRTFRILTRRRRPHIHGSVHRQLAAGRPALSACYTPERYCWRNSIQCRKPK